MPWVNGVNGDETNGVGRNSNLRTRKLGFDSVAIARPQTLNPKKERLT